MSRYGLLTPSQFLETLAYLLKIRIPDIIELKSQAELTSPGLFASDVLQFAADKNVECVLEGGCSSLHLNEATVTFPLGKCMVKKGEPDKSWLHAVVDEYTRKNGKRPASILLYANCCGDYVEDQKELIRTAFPDIVWRFPYVPDLCEGHYPDRTAKALLEAGYLEIVPAPSENEPIIAA